MSALDIDWGLLGHAGPVDVAGNFATGYKVGAAVRQKRETDSALSAYASGDPNAIPALYRTDPELAVKLEDHATKRHELATRQHLATQYAGNPQAGQQAAVAAGDFDLATEFGKLDEGQRKRTADFWQMAAPLAYKLKQEPDPAKRKALWDQAKPMLATTGVDQPHLDAFDPTNDQMLDAAITTGQKVNDLISQGKIEWHQQGENPSFATDAMGHPVGTANPASGGAAHVTDKASYDAVPPGGQYYDPDGHLRTKGGQSGAGSTGGFP